MPSLTKFYPGLTPMHIDHMTLREVFEYRTQMHQHLAENSEG